MTSGYSGTPLPKKLGIKERHRIALLNAPDGFASTLTPMPDGVDVETALGSESLDVLLFFAKTRRDLQARFSILAKNLAPNGGLWIGWPKRSSGVETDLTENVIRAIGLNAGLVDNKVCAIDETWSGLRFVYRLVDRPKKMTARK
jgi:hypothetical protein